MVSHARKRQRTKKPVKEHVQPLGSVVSLTDDASKDDEERRLESLLFGTPFVPSGKNKNSVLVSSDHEDEENDGDSDGKFFAVDKELENLTDADLFFVDEGPSTVTRDLVHSDAELDEPGGSYLSEENSKRPHKGDDDDDEVDSNRPNVPPPSQGKARKPPAWVDPDDANLQVSLASDKRRRKLRDSLLDDAVGGREYERRLRRQFQRINPVPDWASNARQKLHPKRRRPSTSSASRSEHDDAEENDVAGLISSTTGILSAAKKSSVLAQGTLRIERLRDANQSARADGSIKTVQFHPSPHVPVLLTASSDRRLSLFNIDGHTNPHLQTLHIPTLPLTNAVFHPTGSSVLLTGPRPFYYTYDLQSGATHRSPRGLWGTTFNRSNPSSQDLGMDTCAFNPTGDILAVAGRRGHVHLVDWNSGAGQVIASLKMNASVKSLWWSKSNNARQGNELLTLGENAEVYVWDVGERRCIRRWRDDGEFGSLVMSGDPTGKYLSIGARSGYVNIYGQDASLASKSDKPRLLKAIGNLTTPISTLRFNHDSQLLAIASNSKKDQMRLIHLPSLTAYANWPTSATPLGHVTSIDFSVGSEYLAIGNNRGHVLLYHLQDFGIQ